MAGEAGPVRLRGSLPRPRTTRGSRPILRGGAYARPLEEFLGPTAPGTSGSIIGGLHLQEEAAAACSGWSWAKVVIVKEREGLAMAVLPACCTIDMDRLKGLIGLGEIELASVEEILRTFPGCELGAIPPFGRLFRVPTS